MIKSSCTSGDPGTEVLLTTDIFMQLSSNDLEWLNSYASSTTDSTKGHQWVFRNVLIVMPKVDADAFIENLNTVLNYTWNTEEVRTVHNSHQLLGQKWNDDCGSVAGKHVLVVPALQNSMVRTCLRVTVGRQALCCSSQLEWTAWLCVYCIRSALTNWKLYT